VWSIRLAVGGGKFPSVQREEYSKIRKKLESSFPELPDLSKVSCRGSTSVWIGTLKGLRD
jgi:hypothetical protein